MVRCAFCNREMEFEGRVSRSDTCPHCSRDLHCCRQCQFYDPRSYNECREVVAERVVDKEKENFCDYFTLKGAGESKSERTAATKQALEDLFKKK